MPPSQWLPLVNFVLTLVVGVLLFTMRGGFRAGQWSAQLELKLSTLATEMERRFIAIETRMSRAGSDASDLATDVQGLPERLRAFFVPIDYKELVEEKNRGIWGVIATMEGRLATVERELRDSGKRGENRAV